MRVLVCGDRNWFNRAAIRRELAKLPAGTIIIEGEARGADTIAREEALALGLSVKRFPADWAHFGRAAGPIRNLAMLNAKPDRVLAFHTNIAASKGTANMVKIATKAGKPVEVFTS